MMKLKIAIVQPQDNLSELGPLLHSMGLAGTFFSDVKKLQHSMQEFSPDLLLIDRTLSLNSEGLGMPGKDRDAPRPILLAEKDDQGFRFVNPKNEHEFRLTDLHDYLRQNLTRYSRENIRLAVDLPAVFSQCDNSRFAQVTSLSRGGVFVKTAPSDLEVGESLNMTISLLGHYIEIDVAGHIAYRVTPCKENHYAQGFGICFDQITEATTSRISKYLSACLTKGSANNPCRKKPPNSHVLC